MAHVRIEMDRGKGWELRAEGNAEATREQVLAQLQASAIQHPHRAFLDGVLIGEVKRPGSRAKVIAY